MSVAIDYVNLCRICLCEVDLCDILLLGEFTMQWINDIHSYYNVKLSFFDRKSTKLCYSCIQKVDAWRWDVRSAAESQLIIDFLDKTVQEHKERNN